MKNKLAKIISYLFVPPINLLITFVILTTQVYLDSKLILVSILLAFIFGLALPILVFVYLRKKGKILNDDATIKDERTLPYIIGTGLAINALVLAFIFKLHPIILALWLAYVLIQIIMIIINLYWKISAHLIGIGIPIATLYFLYQFDMIYFLILPLIIAWARLALKVHTPMQLLAGFLLGTVPTYYILTESIKFLT